MFLVILSIVGFSGGYIVGSLVKKGMILAKELGKEVQQGDIPSKEVWG